MLSQWELLGYLISHHYYVRNLKITVLVICNIVILIDQGMTDMIFMGSTIYYSVLVLLHFVVSWVDVMRVFIDNKVRLTFNPNEID